MSTKYFKINLPQFDGIDVDDWVFRLEEYFDVAKNPLEQRIKVARFHMIGPAYAWYKWMIHNDYTQDWKIFADALYKRFGSNLYTNPQEALKELKQEGTVKEYQTQFEALSTRVTGLTEQWLINFFVAGLNDYLKCQLRLAKPPTYHEAVALAFLHEQNYTALQQSLKQSSIVSSFLTRPSTFRTPAAQPASNPINRITNSHSTFSNKTRDSSSVSTPPTLVTSPPKTKPPYKRFTAAELRE
uniref:Retrotransposon gag domain-containing protein n=1 Tax=Cajanus cajan TaxID=3821 RepID=A0A151R2W9_CAJCA|nr:hypothetical protein KK1_041913 [Cajanus cajan]